MNIKKCILIFIVIFIYSHIPEAQELYALSLGKLMRQCEMNPDVHDIANVQNIIGFIADSVHKDIIILGTSQKENKIATFSVDDIADIVNSFYGRKEIPQCLIELNRESLNDYHKLIHNFYARGEQPNKRISEWMYNKRENKITVQGVRSGSNVSRVMVEADICLKQIINDKINLRVRGFLTYKDLLCQYKEEDFNLNLNDVSFAAPGFILTYNPRILFQGEGINMLPSQHISCVPDTTKLKGGAEIFSAPTREFCNMFNKFFPQITKKKNVFAQLETLMRLHFLMNVLQQQHYDHWLDLTFWTKHQAPQYDIAANVPMIYTSTYLDAPSSIIPNRTSVEWFQYAYIFTFGGISFAIDNKNVSVNNTFTNQLNALRKDVLHSRPSDNNYLWKIMPVPEWLVTEYKDGF